MGRAVFAGVIATAIVSALIYVNVRLGFVPRFDMLAEIVAFNARIGLPATEAAAWITHATIGAVFFAVAFAALEPILPGGAVGSGLFFGVVTFLVMMVSFMPLAGREFFALDLGWEAIGAALAFNLAYGGVLGATYGLVNEAVEP